MSSTTCPSCGTHYGSNAACLVCREAATRELAREASAVTPRNVEAAVKRVGNYLERRPWWARAASRELLARLHLLWMVLRDTLTRKHWLPWHGIATLAASALYVLAPIDLIFDFLGPLGFADDLLVVTITFDLQRRQLLDYCRRTGKDPGQFGFDAMH